MKRLLTRGGVAALIVCGACGAAIEQDKRDPKPEDGGATAVPPATDAAEAVAPGDARADTVVPPAARLVDGGAPASGVVPVLWLDVRGPDGGLVPQEKIPSAPYLAGRIRVIEDHDGKIDMRNPSALLQRPVTLDMPMGIHLHGNFSLFVSPKRSMKLELRNAAGQDAPAPLLGMAPESDFIIYGCYIDKTCLRNPLTYHIGRSLGRWHPNARFAEVIVNGKYEGLWLVTEKIKRDKNRVNIPHVAADANGDVTGGYIFRREGNGRGGARDFTSALKWVYTYGDPDPPLITAAQKTYLLKFVNDFEATMNRPDWRTSFRQWIDLPSWVDNFIVQEASRNGDAYKKSQYFTKQSQANGGLLYAGPFWDYDAAWGNLTDFYDAHKPEGWAIKSLPTTYDGVAFYFRALWDDAAVQNAIRCRWNELRKGPLNTDALKALIDSWVKPIATAQARDNMRWNYIGACNWPNTTCKVKTTSYAEDIAYLKDWIAKRLAWMDAALAGTCP